MVIGHCTAFQRSKSHGLPCLQKKPFQFQNAGFIVTSQNNICMSQHLCELNHLTVHVIHLILGSQGNAFHETCLAADHHQRNDCIGLLSFCTLSIGLRVEVVKADGWW